MVNRNIQKPPPLKPGDTIGIAAPASPFKPEALQQGIAWLEGAGFQVQIPPDIYGQEGYLAGSDHQRVAVLHRLFADENIQGIICARGGYGSLRLLEHLDLELIRRHPKFFMGFSDISVLLWVFYQQARMVTWHGPMGTSLAGSHPNDQQHLRDVLTPQRRRMLTFPESIGLGAGTVSAPVAGGNLTSLCHLVGTCWQPSFAGHILLLEDCNEAPYRLDRMLAQMHLAGCLRGVAGLLLGSFDGCGPPETIQAIFNHYFKGIPGLANLPIGHAGRNLALPFGVLATLNTRLRVLILHESPWAGDRPYDQDF